MIMSSPTWGQKRAFSPSRFSETEVVCVAPGRMSTHGLRTIETRRVGGEFATAASEQLMEHKSLKPSTWLLVLIHGGVNQDLGFMTFRAAVAIAFAALFIWRGSLRIPTYLHATIDAVLVLSV